MKLDKAIKGLVTRIAVSLAFTGSYNFDRAAYDAVCTLKEQIESEHPEWKEDA
jgi:hypothetical protein